MEELYQCVVEADVSFQTSLDVVELHDGHLCCCDGQNVLHTWRRRGHVFKCCEGFWNSLQIMPLTHLSVFSAVLPGFRLERCSPHPVKSSIIQFSSNSEMRWTIKTKTCLQIDLQSDYQITHIYALLPLQHHTNVQVALFEAKAILGWAKQLQPGCCASETPFVSFIAHVYH